MPNLAGGRVALPLLCLSLVACARSATVPRVVAPAEVAAPAPPPAAPLPAAALPPGGRLPTTVVPVAYALALTVDPARGRFAGEARIDVTLLEPAEALLLHGHGLAIASVEVTPEGGAPLAAIWETLDAESGLGALRLPRTLPPGALTVRVAYDAAYSEGLRGLYRVAAGEDHYAFTQLQPTWARRMFPCFDEPGWKTPFTVSVTVPEGARAFANAPAVAEEPAPAGWKTVRFAPTPPLPTYLVALAVGPFDVVEAPPVPPSEVRASPLPLRGIAVRGKGAELAHALARTGPILTSLERYLGSPYPFAKLDLVAVPDFGAGAMENPGLVTYRETLLLLGELAPEWQRRAFAEVTAHELAHMWFGNLVTLRFWDDLWLNEALATWQATRTVAELHPEHRAELEALGATHYAMAADALASARSVRQPIASEHDIHSAFDPITYEKGAAVLRMVEAWVGSEAFREGLRRYLARHAWGSATAADLLSALSGAAHRDVGPVMRSFLDRPGVPFVAVELACEGRRPRVHLRQERYLPLGSAGTPRADWTLPVCVTYGGDRERATRCTLLDAEEGTVELEGRSCPSWVLPNADGAGYYRFALSAPVRAALRTGRFERLPASAQLVLADGLEAAFRNGSLRLPELLDALAPLASSGARRVAEVPMELLELLIERLAPPERRLALRELGRHLYRAQHARLGWEARGHDAGDGELELLRAGVARFMARVAEEPGARSEARRRALAYLGSDGARHPDAIEPALLGTALAVAVQDEGAPFFERLLAAFVASEDALFRARALAAIGAARDPELAARARALALDPRLRVSEALTPLWAQLEQPETRAEAWAFVDERLDELVARLGPRSDRLPGLGRALCTREDADRLAALFEPRVSAWPSGPRALASALESVRLCAALREAHFPTAP